MLKVIGGLVIFLTLPSLLFFAFVYFKYNEPRPQGIEGEKADVLAIKMLEALNTEAYKNTDYLAWSFRNNHHYQWHKTKGRCKVTWSHFMVDLNLKNPKDSEVYVDRQLYRGEEKARLIKKALDLFNNDSFWLVAPYKVFDDGTKRELIETYDGKQALLVTYTAGGSTPGDSYLWHLDDDFKPKSFQMWVDIIPIGGLEASWNHWKETSTGALLPTHHDLLFFSIALNNITTK